MRLLLTLAALLLLAACVTPASVPRAPEVSSPAGEQCVVDCQTEYAACEQPCGIGSSASRVPACQKACYESLDQCYQGCTAR